MNARDRVASTLRRARLRLGLLASGRRAAWALLAAVLCLEVGLALHSRVPTLGAVLLVVAAGLSLGAVGAVVFGRGPETTLVAEVLDARLGSGAAVVSAAEVLEGRHARFASGVLASAGRALEGVRLGQVLPASLPTGLLLGSAAAVLLPFLLPTNGAGQVTTARANELPALLAPEALGAGGESSPGESPPAPSALAPVLGGEPQLQQPWDALPLDAIEALRAQLSELSSDLPPSDSSGGNVGTGDQGSSDLREALESGDPSRVQAVLDRLAASAAKGDRAAAAEIEELAAALGAPGAGGAAAAPDAGSGSVTPHSVDPVVGVGLDLPPAFAEACRRYF